MKNWETLVLETLDELAHRDRQERAWLLGDAAPFPISAAELICQLFDDSGLGDMLEQGAVFSSAADALLVEIGQRLDSLDVTQPVAQLLRDPRWNEICRIASLARAQISADISTSPSEP